MEPSEKIEKLIKETRLETAAQTDKRITDKAKEVFIETRQALDKYKPRPAVWRIIMRSPITKLAAAGVIIAAVITGFHFLGSPIEVSTPAFAEVVQPLLTAEGGTFNMTINVVNSGLDWINCGDEPVQTIEVIFAGSSRTRWNVPTGEVLVANFQYGKVMILIPSKMQAAIMQVSPPGVIPIHNRFNKLLELRRLIEYALEAEDDFVEFIGEEKTNGVTAIGYHITGPAGDITVWADAKTRLPIQVEQSIGNETAIVSDITYDVISDESLFSVEPPEGYSTAAPEEDKEPTFIVRGTVTDAATGEPIAGAKVSDDGYGSEPYRGAVTDSEGRYQYFTWPEEHRIKAEATGYKTQREGIGGLFHAEAKDEKVIDFELERE